MNLRPICPLLGALVLGCGPAVDLNAVPEAKARCEASTEELRVPTARMLPGRRCMGCHLPGGQASRIPWTAAGTVYSSANSDCNQGGVAGATVELIDATGTVVLALVTNGAGNFFTAEPLGFRALRARIRKDGKTREMNTLQTTLDCAGCHYPSGPSPGRIYFP